MALNAIDGMLAREHGMKSPEGAVLNELGDVISDAALYLPFALVAGVNAALVVLVVIAAIVGEMAGALGPLLGGQRRYDGPLGKSDRAFAFGTLGFLIGVGVTPGMWTTVYSRRAARAFSADHRQPGARHRRRSKGAHAMTTIFGIPANVVYATAGVYALLIIASIIVWMLSRRDESVLP